MEDIKSLAKWWNNEVVVPSPSTSVCMVSGPGALTLLRNLTILMSVEGRQVSGQNPPDKIPQTRQTPLDKIPLDKIPPVYFIFY